MKDEPSPFFSSFILPPSSFLSSHWTARSYAFLALSSGSPNNSRKTTDHTDGACSRIGQLSPEPEMSPSSVVPWR